MAVIILPTQVQDMPFTAFEQFTAMHFTSKDPYQRMQSEREY